MDLQEKNDFTAYEMRIKHVTGSDLWDQALSWGSSDNQGVAKPLFS
jgi:hypothetical protein